MPRGFGSLKKQEIACPVQRVYIESEVLFVFAIIKTGGKQYKVQEGDIIFVEKLDAEEGATVEFGEVLAVSGESPQLQVPRLLQRFSRTARAKRFIFSNISPRRTKRRKSVTDSPIQRFRSNLS